MKKTTMYISPTFFFLGIVISLFAYGNNTSKETQLNPEYGISSEPIEIYQSQGNVGM